MIRVLIADDQKLVRSGFRIMLELEEDMEVVGEAENGRDAVEGVRLRPTDVVLMDIQMPRLDGIEATRLLGELPKPPRVLVLTTFEMDEYLYGAMKAGASGFLLKDIGREELVAAVRAVAQGERLIAPAMVTRLVERFVQRPAPVAGTPAELAELSERELDTMRLVARGLSNAEIGEQLFIGEATVKSHVAAILRKLGLRDRVQIVVTAYECGLIEPSG